jgi:hypothetical protein
MTRKLPVALFGLACSMAVWGCAAPPTARVDAIRTHLDTVSGDARTYAAEAYTSATEALAAVDREMADQAARLGPLRSDEQTNQLLVSAEAATKSLDQAITDAKSRMQTEARDTVAAARGTIERLKASIADLPARVVPDDQRLTWTTDLSGAETSLDRADTLVADNPQQARQTAEDARDVVQAIDTEVTQAHTAQEEARAAAVARASRGDVDIPQAVLADGRRLPAGAYRLRLGNRDESAGGRWVEFLHGEQAAGRAVAIVVPDSDIGAIAKSPPPRNEARLDRLRGGEYLRVWLNRDRVNYLVYLPIPPRA